MVAGISGREKWKGITFDPYSGQETVKTMKTKAEVSNMGTSRNCSHAQLQICRICKGVTVGKKIQVPAANSTRERAGRLRVILRKITKWKPQFAKPNSVVLYSS